MARPRTPSKVLELKGAFKRNPNRARESEPEVETQNVDTRAPRRLDKEQKKVWRELIKAIPAGVLSASDLIQVEIVTCLLAEFRLMNGKVPTERITRLTSEMGKLGLNPSARAGLKVEKPKTNKFAE